jgi:Flp pilus assembly protein protease CpaA
MVLDLSIESIVPFVTITSLLAIYSILDIRERRIKNEYVLVGGVVGCVALVLTGHFVANIVLHATAIVIILSLVYILFRIGSIGGADAKILFVVALISPGVELGVWSQQVLEAIIGLGGELIVMLLGGYLYWRFRGKNEDATPPLIPFLLVGYLAIQLIALF